MTENKIKKRVKKFNIDYKAEFIPFSQSRNKVENCKSLNWKVSLTRNGVTCETDYQQGYGHIVNYNNPPDGVLKRDTFKMRKLVDYTCETGLVANRWFEYNCSWGAFSRIFHPKPKLHDVLYSLLLDSDVLNYTSFEDWATNFGYEADSRKAETVYNDCLKIALSFKNMFSYDEIEELTEIFRDY